MGYFLITSQRGRCRVSWHLQNQVCANADQGFYEKRREILVMRALASFADDDGGNCWPSLEALAKRSGYKQATVCAVLRKFRESGWIRVKHTGRVNSYQILPHGFVLKAEQQTPERTAKNRTLGSKNCKADFQKSEGRVPKNEHDSYQGLSSTTQPPPKPPKGVVVVFDFEEEEVTKEKTLKDGPPLRAKQSRRRSSFVTPASGENPSGFAPRFPSATRGGDLEDRCSVGQPDAVPDVHEQLLARARECGRPVSDAEAVQDDWRNRKCWNRIATFDYREEHGTHPSQEDAKREAAKKTDWTKYR